MSYYEWYPEPAHPDRPGDSKPQPARPAAKNWWAERWIGSLEQLMDAGRLRRGRRYARRDRSLSLEERAGGVVAEF